MIFGYTYEEAKKTVVQLISALVLLAGFFIVFDPAFEPAVIAVATAIFGVIAVVGAKNATADDWTKAVQSLATSVIGLVGVFTTVNPGDTAKWLTILAIATPPIWVWAPRNKPIDPVVTDPLASRQRV